LIKVEQIIDKLKLKTTCSPLTSMQPQEQEKIENEIKSNLEQAGLIPTWMLTKTSFCKHKYGCYENVIIGFYNLLVKSFAIKFLINNLSFLGNR